jgi:transposase, IS5 family
MVWEAKTLQLGRVDFIPIRMQSSSPDPSQLQFLAPGLKEMLNPKEPLYQLAERFPWAQLETHFGALYATAGRPAKPVRLMVALLLLKQLNDLGDETVVAQWVHNPYWQYLSGESVFQWKPPIEPTDLVHFRQRIGEDGMQAIFALSIRLHGKAAQEKEVVIDTTVQEKNITFPTDTKLRHRIMQRCVKIARREGVQLRQSYRRVAKKLLLAQRWRRHPKHAKKARAAARKLKTIAGRLVRELRRKLPAAALEKHGKDLALYERVLAQQRSDHDKVYSLHEPQVYCVAKGKEAKQYEFGAKASVVLTKRSAVIVGVLSLPENQYDGHTLPSALAQTEVLVGRRPAVGIVDRGYRGTKQVGTTMIVTPTVLPKGASAHARQSMRRRFRRRAAIEPVIGHLKSDFRLARNYLKGSVGDSVNLLLAASAFNIRKWLRLVVSWLLAWREWLDRCLCRPDFTPGHQKCF